MAQKTSQTRQIQFLLTNLLLLVVCILGLVLLAAVYPVLLAPDPTRTLAPTFTHLPTRTLTFTPTVTPTFTPTRTPHDTFTPTITLTPTWTPTITPSPTPTSLATLTPARPVAFAGRYLLAEWTPERAEYMAAMMSNYPNRLFPRIPVQRFCPARSPAAIPGCTAGGALALAAGLPPGAVERSASRAALR